MGERRASTRALEEWLSKGGAPDYPLIVHDFGGTDADQGRATLAARDIKQGERILQVPFSLLLDAAASTRVPEQQVAEVFDVVRPVLDAVDNKLPLALFMLYELSKGAASFWKPYFDALPARVNLPMLWSEEDLELLRGSPLYITVKQQKQQIRDWHQHHILPTVRIYQVVLSPSSDAISLDYSLEKFEWVLSMIMSRAFWHYDLDKQLWVPHMVPMADLINHSLTNQNVSQYTFDSATQMFNVNVRLPYQKGDQVFITYCRESNFEFLKTYAMITENNEIKYTEVFVSDDFIIQICSDESERRKRTEYLSQRALQRQTYPIKSEEFPLGLVQALRLYHLKGDNYDSCFENQPVSIENEMQVYASIEHCVQNQLSSYQTTAKEDAAILAQTNSRLSPTAYLAVTYRNEDKLFLEEVACLFADMRKELSLASDASAPLVMELFFDCLAQRAGQKEEI